MLLKSIKYLVTQNEKREILEDVDVLIEKNTIVKIGKNLGSDGIDCSNKIVMPGLINCHTHLGMTSLRGISDDKELAPWLEEIQKAEHAMSEEDVAAAVYLGITEALRSGTTTIVDQYYLPEPTIKAATSLGIRATVFKDFFTAHKTANDIVLPSSSAETITIGIGPHSIYGTTEEFLKNARTAATEQSLLLHIHVAETRKERAECKKKNGTLPVEYLDSIRFLGSDVMMVHCDWLTKGELDIIAKHGTRIVHCPSSNMKLAGGSAMPLREMQERGITVALGTDSAVSNNSLDMFREMHVCALLHKHHYWSGEAITAQRVLDMATVNGAQALQLNTGRIEEGKLADVITLDLNDYNLMPITKDRVISHLVYAANGMNVADVIVNGKLLMENKKFI